MKYSGFFVESVEKKSVFSKIWRQTIVNACSLPYENDIHLKLTWIIQKSKTSSSCIIHVFFQFCIIHVATWIIQISQHEFYNTGNMNSTKLGGASSLQLYIFSVDPSYSWIHLSREIKSFEFWDVACFFWKSWFDSLVICNQNRSMTRECHHFESNKTRSREFPNTISHIKTSIILGFDKNNTLKI